MSDVLLDVWIPGRPRPQGSMKTFMAGGHAHARHSDPTLSHRAHVISTLAENWNLEPLTGAVAVDVVFTFARPKNHYGTGRNADVIKESAPEHHIQAPDSDKLSRLTLDALEMAGVVRNDSQVCRLTIDKLWGRDDSTHLVMRGTDG